MSTPDRRLWEDINSIDALSDLPPRFPRESLLNRIVPKPQSKSVFRLPAQSGSGETDKPRQDDFRQELTESEYQRLRFTLKPFEDYLHQTVRELVDNWKAFNPIRNPVRKSLFGPTFSFYIQNYETAEGTKATVKANSKYFWGCQKFTAGNRFIEFDNQGRITGIGSGNNHGKNDILIKAEDPKNAGIYMKHTVGRTEYLRALSNPDLYLLAENMIGRTLNYSSPRLEMEVSRSPSDFEVYIEDPQDHKYLGFKRA